MLSRRTIVMVYGLLTVLAGWGYLSHRAAGREIDVEAERHARLLATPVAELRMDGTTFEDAVTQLRRASGVSITIDAESIEACGVDLKKPLHQLLFDLPLDQMLRAVLNEAQGQTRLAWWWNWHGDAIVLTTKEMADEQNVVTRVYDIRDIDARWWRFDEGPTFDLRSGPAYGSGKLFSGSSPTPEKDKADAIIKFITTSVVLDTWRDAGGMIGWISAVDGRLLITQTADNHREIAKLLEAARHQTGDEWPAPLH